MAKIEVGRYSELMRRYLSMAGVVEVAQELAPEISPVFILEAERPEWEFIKNQKLCSSQISITGVAATQSTGRIRNPAGSGVMAIVHEVNFSAPSGGANYTMLLYRVAVTVDLANIVATVTRDTRFPALNTSALIASQANVGATGDYFYHTYFGEQSPVTVRLPLILMPGFALDMNLEAPVNTTWRGNAHWLERRVGELEIGTP